MKFNCSKESLMGALAIAQKAVSSKTTLPILEGILFSVANNNLLLRSTDLEIGVEVNIPAEVDTEGDIVLSSSIIGELIRKLSGSDVFFESDDHHQIKIECLLSNFTLKGLSADEFPAFPEVIEDHIFSIDATVLKELIKGTLFSVATNENIPVLTGVKIELHEDNINLIALDGYRLALRFGKIKNAVGEDLSVIIPAKSLSEINKVLTNYTGDVIVKFSKNQIFFEMENTQFTSRLLEGDFINYKQIIPVEKTTQVKINRRLLLESSERAALLAREGKNNLIKMDFNQDQLILTSNAEIGNVFEIIPIENIGESLKIAFNSKFLIEALRVIEDEELMIHMTTSVGPGVILPVEGNEFIYLILPVRIAEEN
ncbi:DNA polymerase III subunit beta [Acetobacterium paludosum]|uniref:Beta sliding clamp n=2 Tax=Acetobacterium TaxID=33951 RepID=A0A923I1T1_9FIRM|nr:MULTISPECIES: DNA polymerase III subunit beta [Acetobacterium]MBC3797767.1 DNA polymerase III subunit beta [Acetobacterium tundrae]MBC3888478.1 DNA polymerase III subunit beta [Acetobacterium paludosum]